MRNLPRLKWWTRLALVMPALPACFTASINIQNAARKCISILQSPVVLLLASLLAMRLLHEKMDAARWLALALGFAVKRLESHSIVRRYPWVHSQFGIG